MTYHNQSRANEITEAFQIIATFLFLNAVLIGGAAAVLIILDHMEKISPTYCLVSLGIYVATVVAALWIVVKD